VPTETNKPSVLRLVKRDPVAEASDAPKTGILFERVAETKCPRCRGAIPLTTAEPLSSASCPGCGTRVFVPGRVGGFLLYARIGEGEMGTIYRATDESLGRDVAIKLVRGCQDNNAESLDRLRREACAAGKLNHPRVAQVYALNFSNGHPYLVMELVTGQDFSLRLAREKRIEERIVLKMALDVAEGLSALHREKLVHGDIKPANIVLDRDGNAKLVDFGLCGMRRRDSSGALIGTPDYIAPELLRGAEDTHSSDLYSLGATMYYLLAGHPPFDCASPSEVVKAKMLQPALPLETYARNVSEPTRKLVMRMLDPVPAKRPINSDHVAAELRNALSKLDHPAVESSAAPDSTNRFLARLGLRRQSSFPTPSETRHRRLIAVLLGIVALIELLVAFKNHSFEKTGLWLREEAGKSETRPVPTPEAIAAKPAEMTLEVNPLWQSTNLGEHTQGGSTMKMGGVLIIQGMGTDMWKGYDRCRFVWTKQSGSYALSAQVKAIADNDNLALSGLLVKGEDPSAGSGLLFGFLGSGELILQARQSKGRPAVIKRSGERLPLPTYLKLIRCNRQLEALVSTDGRSWNTFASCELDLPTCNTVGFCVSAQAPNTLATAKFAEIHLLTPGQPAAPSASALPAAAR